MASFKIRKVFNSGIAVHPEEEPTVDLAERARFVDVVSAFNQNPPDDYMVSLEKIRAALRRSNINPDTNPAFKDIVGTILKNKAEEDKKAAAKNLSGFSLRAGNGAASGEYTQRRSDALRAEIDKVRTKNMPKPVANPPLLNRRDGTSRVRDFDSESDRPYDDDDENPEHYPNDEHYADQYEDEQYPSRRTPTTTAIKPITVSKTIAVGAKPRVKPTYHYPPRAAMFRHVKPRTNMNTGACIRRTISGSVDLY